MENNSKMVTRKIPQLTLGSLFDGSGGFPLGGAMCGIKTIWTSEISPFPLLVEHKNFPNAKHYGDINGLKGNELEAVDIITFGSPCQDLSIAGKRSGIMLEGGRSNLFFQAIRIIKEMREATNGKYPKYAVFENVRGVFSSNKGEDFLCVLKEFASICETEVRIPGPPKEGWPHCGEILGDTWSLAWRLFDAQFHGIPQRRERIYLVGDFTGQCAGKIQFISNSLPGYPEPSFGPRKSTPYDIGDSFERTNRSFTAGFRTENSGQSRGIGYQEERSPTLSESQVPAMVEGKFLFESHGADSRYNGPQETAPTLCGNMGTGGGNIPLVTEQDPSYLLRMRAGCEGGGKGPLVQKERSGAITPNQDQTLFQPVKEDTESIMKEIYNSYYQEINNVVSRNPQSDIEIYEGINQILQVIIEINKKMIEWSLQNQNQSLSSEEKDCEKFKVYNICSKHNPLMLYETKTTRTLDADGGKPTSNQGGMVVCEKSVFPEENIYNTQENNHIICQKQSVGISRPGFTSGEKARFNFSTPDEQSPTLIGGGPNAVAIEESQKDSSENIAYGLGRDVFNSGKNAKFALAIDLNVQPTMIGHAGGVCCPDSKNKGEETASALMVKDLKDSQCACGQKTHYIVRKLTPTECARLQGFPDDWTDDLAISNPSEEQLQYWYEVWRFWDEMRGKKPKSIGKVKKWLSDPISDATLYSLWGNGVALPNVYYVLSGIVWNEFQKEQSI